ncbi:MAG: ABC transporter ATP-binding protein [Thioploca sp.]|nr:ABC transporter ATP-binding protein [Thioploca sp.]
MLTLQNVGFAIDGYWLMQKASLVLSLGQLTAIIGPNGAGKTTLLRLLAGLWQPTKGSVKLNESELSQFRQRLLAQYLTFVPQNTTVNFAFTVKEVVMMGRHAHLRRLQPSTDYDHHCVEQAMLEVDIAYLAQRPITELSGGERQRVLIARSLATEAKIILLDEPTANLDVAHALEILNLLKQLTQAGKAVAFSIHDLNTASRYADQVVLVHNNHIVAVGLPDEVLTEEIIAKVFEVQVEKIISKAIEKSFYLFDMKKNRRVG